MDSWCISCAIYMLALLRGLEFENRVGSCGMRPLHLCRNVPDLILPKYLWRLRSCRVGRLAIIAERVTVCFILVWLPSLVVFASSSMRVFVLMLDLAFVLWF
jgi:hypothetical protein